VETYWYISDDKLAFSSEDAARLRDRFEGKVQLGFAPVGVGAEVGIRPRADPTLVEQVHRFERMVDREHVATDLAEAAVRRPPPSMFRFQGFGARLLENACFWVAGAAGSTGFLLVGSISNAVGGRIDEETAAAFHSGGPSADPLGVIRALINLGEEAPETGGSGGFAGMISSMWLVIVLGGTRDVALEDLPSVTGIAQYAGRQRVPDLTWSDEQREVLSGIERIVVGSPFFVAQSA
jgi:uncharacterized protein DUF7019